MQWIVAKTKASREQWARDNIERQGVTVYLPIIAERRSIRGRVVEVVRPLFPRYLFVRIENGQWRFLTGTYGVTGVILDVDGPAIMPDKEVEKLKKREDNQGRIRLPEAPRKFLYGQTVTLTDGPMQNCKGIYQGTDEKSRAKVLMDFMGRRSTVLIGEDLLEAA